MKNGAHNTDSDPPCQRGNEKNFELFSTFVLSTIAVDNFVN